VQKICRELPDKTEIPQTAAIKHTPPGSADLVPAVFSLAEYVSFSNRVVFSVLMQGG
jgi:hypothetical protein